MALAERAVYSTQPRSLREQIDQLLDHAPAPGVEGQVFALIVPDSNRLAGGATAAEAYRHLAERDFDTVVIISPSHEGAFGRLSICEIDTYHSPLGEVPVNDHLRNELCDEDDDFFLDDSGHFHTEGADVQLPFLLRTLGEDFNIVPIVMGEESPAFCRELGTALGEVLYGRRALIVATADVLAADDGAIEAFRDSLEKFDTSQLLHLLGSESVRLEGMGAVVSAVIAAQRRGADRARILRLEPPTDDHVGAVSAVLWRSA